MNLYRKLKKEDRGAYFFFILYLCLFDAKGYYPPPGSNARTSLTVRVGCCVAVWPCSEVWLLAAVDVPFSPFVWVS